jgi:hypothetical protein
MHHIFEEIPCFESLQVIIEVFLTVPFESLQLHSQLVLFALWPAGCGHIAP